MVSKMELHGETAKITRSNFLPLTLARRERNMSLS